MAAPNAPSPPDPSPTPDPANPDAPPLDPALARTIGAARDALARASALVVTAGAGMGVDSGLPDFRGNEGFWKAYPPFARLGLGFTSLANPRWFHSDPALAWGFYGHRLELYRATVPHAGFELLRAFASTLPDGAFVFTSNVDGQFQKAGFGRVCEAHGSIHHAQCLDGCGAELWPCDDRVNVDPDTMRAAEPWPRCPVCGGLARPNILMFGDGGWDSQRSDRQERELARWLGRVQGPIAIVELGAGSAIPTVRAFSERLSRGRDATLIRINPREPDGPRGTLSLPLPGLAGLRHLFA